MTGGSDSNGPSGGERRGDERPSRIAYGIPIGAGFGVALGLTLDNLALGIAIGAGLGVAFGAAMDQRRWGTEQEGSGRLRTRLMLAMVVGILLLLVGVAALAFRSLQ
jgi:hypothetical protein